MSFSRQNVCSEDSDLEGALAVEGEQRSGPVTHCRPLAARGLYGALPPASLLGASTVW